MTTVKAVAAAAKNAGSADDTANMSAALDVFVNTIEAQKTAGADLNNFMDMLGDSSAVNVDADGNPIDSVWDTLTAQVTADATCRVAQPVQWQP